MKNFWIIAALSDKNWSRELISLFHWSEDKTTIYQEFRNTSMKKPLHLNCKKQDDLIFSHLYVIFDKKSKQTNQKPNILSCPQKTFNTRIHVSRGISGIWLLIDLFEFLSKMIIYKSLTMSQTNQTSQRRSDHLAFCNLGVRFPLHLTTSSQ